MTRRALLPVAPTVLNAKAGVAIAGYGGSNKVGEKTARISFGSNVVLGDCTVPQSVPRQKHVIAQSFRVLVDHLRASGFDTVNSKRLRLPSLEVFKEISLLLLKQIDPHHAYKGVFEDEIIKMFETLQYPFPILKSNLLSPEILSAWPDLLAALSWLVELLSYKDAIEKFYIDSNKFYIDSNECADSGGFDFGDPLRSFNSHLSRAYGFFLQGQDENCALEDQHFINSFTRGNQYLVERTAEMAERQSKLEAEIEQKELQLVHQRQVSSYISSIYAINFSFKIDILSKHMINYLLHTYIHITLAHTSLMVIFLHSLYSFQCVHRIQERKNCLVQDSKRFEKLIHELQAHRDSMKVKISIRSADLVNTDQALGSLSEEMVNILRTTESQKYSLQGLSRNMPSTECAQKILGDTREYNRELLAKVRRLERALTGRVASLSASAQRFNKEAEDRAADGAPSVCPIRLNLSAKRTNGLLLTDIRGGVLPLLLHTRSDLTRSRRTLLTKLSHLRNELDQLQIDIASASEQQAQAQLLLVAEEQTHERERGAYELLLSDHEEAVGYLEKRLAAAKSEADEASENIEAAVRRTTEARESCARRAADHVRFVREVSKAVLGAVQLSAGCREIIHLHIARVKKATAVKLSALIHHHCHRLRSIVSVKAVPPTVLPQYTITTHY